MGYTTITVQVSEWDTNNNRDTLNHQILLVFIWDTKPDGITHHWLMNIWVVDFFRRSNVGDIPSLVRHFAPLFVGKKDIDAGSDLFPMVIGWVETQWLDDTISRALLYSDGMHTTFCELENINVSKA